MTLDLVVDERGDVWASGSNQLHQRHGAVGTQSDLTLYLIANCGHVRVSFTMGFARARIMMRPGRPGTRTVRQVCKMLLASGIQTFHLEFIGSQPTMMEVEGIEAIATIMTSHCNEQSILKRPRLYKERLPIAACFRTERLRKLQAKYRQWTRLRGRWSAAKHRLLSAAADQQVIARILRDTAYFDFIGNGYSLLRSSLVEKTGRAVHDQSDQAYGAWIAKSMMQVEFSRRPTHELIETTISTPERPNARIRYDRLLLPWLTSKGEVVVSSTSVTLVIFDACSAT